MSTYNINFLGETLRKIFKGYSLISGAMLAVYVYFFTTGVYQSSVSPW